MLLLNGKEIPRKTATASEKVYWSTLGMWAIRAPVMMSGNTPSVIEILGRLVV